jgi:hypothetical protein
MRKFIILSGFVLLCTGCGEVAPTPSPTPTSSSTANIDPRCLMTPTPGMDTTGIICPGGTGEDSATIRPTVVPTLDPTSTPSSASPLPSFTPRAAVTSSDIACLNGRWQQGPTELLFQYMQTLPPHLFWLRQVAALISTLLVQEIVEHLLRHSTM